MPNGSDGKCPKTYIKERLERMSVEHGGNMESLARQLGYRLEDCVDFSANINPLGVSPQVRETLTATIASLVHYPDVTYTLPRQALGHYHGYASEAVLLGNGAVELFYDLARVLRPEKVLLLSPTFMEYEKAFEQVGSAFVYHPLQAPTYTWQVQDLLPGLDELAKGDVVLICNPNNPTGSLVTRDHLQRLAQETATRELILIIDEAFVDFLGDDERYSVVQDLSDFPHVVVVRSLTKFYAVPGLRLGYALTTHPTYFKQIEAIKPPWTVNALAAATVTSILEDESYRQATLEWLVEEQAFLYDGLSRFHDLEVLKPSVNYIFFEYLGGLDLRQALWKKQLFIRSCHNYHGLTDRHYRVAVRNRADNERLLEALRDLLE